MVRAKFKITKIERTMSSRIVKNEDGSPVKDERGHNKYESCEMWSVHGAPVYGDGDPNHENTKFWEASPNGSFFLGTVNKDAADQFELDKEYYVDFTLAE